jgi:predicted DNA-binding transcriptional regulator
METIYFILGILTVLFTISVIGVVKIWKKVITLEFCESDMEDYISDTADDFSDEIDKLHSHYEKEIERLERNFGDESDGLGKLIDSRVDTLHNHINKKLEKLEGTVAQIIVKENR